MAASTALPSYKGNDADQLFICPYDPVHRISAKRFPYHLMKCRKQHSSSTDWARCPFNARHEIPRPELDYHIATCSDRDYIRQDIEQAVKEEDLVYKNSIQPQPTAPIQPEETEDWDLEADNTTFTLAGGFQDAENIAEEADRFDILEAMQEVQHHVHKQPQQAADLASMTAAQRKNYKRSLKRQEQRNNAAGASGEIAEEEPQKTDEEKLAIIIQQYPLMNSRETGSFVDFVSILNQYCQKNRINQPTYREGPGVMGGFGSECIVMTDIFRTQKYCKTKKEAKRNAAMVALLGLNVSVGPDPTPCKPSASKTAAERERIRQTHESQLLGPGMSKAKSGPPTITRPEVTHIRNEQEVAAAMGRLTVQDPESARDDGWTTVPKKASNPVFQHSLKMAGRGRGIPRK